MSGLHESSNDKAFLLEGNEGQRELLCSNEALSRCPSLGSSKLPDATIQALSGLGHLLRPIYRRMLADGYIMKDGVIVKNHDRQN